MKRFRIKLQDELSMTVRLPVWLGNTIIQLQINTVKYFTPGNIHTFCQLTEKFHFPFLCTCPIRYIMIVTCSINFACRFSLKKHLNNIF